MKVSILGMGRVGSSLGYLLAGEKNIDELVFVDEIKGLSEGISRDISNAYPEASLKIVSGGISSANNSDILVIAASAPTDPKITIRMELLGANKPVIGKIFSNVKLKKSTVVIMVTNPVEPLVYHSLKISRIDPEKIIGFGNSLDTARLKSILSKKTRVPSNRIDITVLGEHGENMLPVFSSARIDGKPIELFKLNPEKLILSLREEGRGIRQLTGGVRFGPARHIFDLIESVIKNRSKIIPVSSYVKNNKHYGVDDVCLSLPCKISSEGISEIVEIPMSRDEKEKLISLSNSLKEIQKNL